MIVYKVTNQRNQSAICSAPNWFLQYPIGEWFAPEGKRIFVFCELKDICGLVKMPWDDSVYRYWECEAEDVLAQQTVAVDWEDDRDLKRFWAGKLYDDYIDLAPKGSYTCSKIKLVREITREELKEKLDK